VEGYDFGMIILGIDPGSIKTGYALVRKEGKKLNYIESGFLNFNKDVTFLERPGMIYDSCRHLVEEYDPDEIAIESLIYVKSPTSLMKLAQARGAMVAAFNKTHVGKIFEYSPNLIKSTVTGDGHASKESIQKFLNMIFGQRSYKTHDESDALAIAVCHALIGGSPVKIAVRSKKRRLRDLGSRRGMEK